MKKKSIAAILLLSMLLVGCSPSNNQNTAENSTQADPLPTQQASNTEATSAQQTEADISAVFHEFEGIDISEEGLKFSTLNNKVNSAQIFCFNEDMIYFSNPSDEWKLYSYDGENLKKLTDIKAFSLNYFKGSIYFLSSEQFNVDKIDFDISGCLYRYDTENGETVQISDIFMCSICVCEKGIYYTNLADNGTYVCKFDQENNKGEQIYRSWSPQCIDNYDIIFEIKNDDRLDYFLEGNGEKILFASDIVAIYECIHNGIYYFLDKQTRTLYSINLKTGENALLWKKGTSIYTVCQNEIYGADQNYLYRLKDGKAETVKIENNEYLLSSELNDHYEYTIKNIFSNEKNAYALVQARHYVDGTEHESSREYKFAELEFSEYGVHVIEDYPDDLVYIKPIT